MDTQIKRCLFTCLFDARFNLFLNFFYHLFDSGGMNPSIFDQSLKTNLGNFPPYWIKTRKDHSLRCLAGLSPLARGPTLAL